MYIFLCFTQLHLFQIIKHTQLKCLVEQTVWRGDQRAVSNFSSVSETVSYPQGLLMTRELSDRLLKRLKKNTTCFSHCPKKIQKGYGALWKYKLLSYVLVQNLLEILKLSLYFIPEFSRCQPPVWWKEWL